MTYAKDAVPPFYHGTRADLNIGDLIRTGFGSNYQPGALSWVYFSARLESAVWGCELAAGKARERIYIVEPTSAYEDDPNLTDKKFPGNPTMSYRSQTPLRIVGELETWEPHSPEALQAMKDGLAALRAEGKDVILD
jgi:Rifampin ADP-ribosyl transferase